MQIHDKLYQYLLTCYIHHVHHNVWLPGWKSPIWPQHTLVLHCQAQSLLQFRVNNTMVIPTYIGASGYIWDHSLESTTCSSPCMSPSLLSTHYQVGEVCIYLDAHILIYTHIYIYLSTVLETFKHRVVWLPMVIEYHILLDIFMQTSWLAHILFK